MAGMFPTMVSDPNDPNRRFRSTLGEDWPSNLRLSFILICVAAVLMLVTAMSLLAQGFPGDPANEALRDSFMMNMRVTAFGNVVLAVLLVSAGAYFRQGSRTARRVAAACVALASFLNVAAFILRITSWASMVVVILLAFAMFFAFRQDANAFVEKQSPRFS